MPLLLERALERAYAAMQPLAQHDAQQRGHRVSADRERLAVAERPQRRARHHEKIIAEQQSQHRREYAWAEPAVPDRHHRRRHEKSEYQPVLQIAVNHVTDRERYQHSEHSHAVAHRGRAPERPHLMTVRG